jgi:hypothetical protein
MGLMDTTGKLQQLPGFEEMHHVFWPKALDSRTIFPKNIRRRFEKANFSRMEWQQDCRRHWQEQYHTKYSLILSAVWNAVSFDVAS